MKHKHAELIKKWADGAKIEMCVGPDDWRDVHPAWGEQYEYRIKPTPQRKPLLDEFGYWWFEYGSGLHPLEGEDQEEHAYRVATAAWQAAHSIKGD